MAVVEEERGGGNARIPPFFALSPTHTRLFPARPPGVSLVKSPAIYLCDWSGRGIYTQRGSVKSGHKFQNFQTGQTDRESGPSDGGEPSFGQTAHKQELLCSEKQTSEEKKRRLIVDWFSGEYPAPQLVCFLFLPRLPPPLRSRCFALGFVLQIHQIPLLIFLVVI